MPSLLHKQQSLAVLIDADNMSCAVLHPLLRRAANYGQLKVKRAYADWRHPRMHRYEQVVSSHAVETRQMFPTATGKNALDIFMTIEVMDLITDGLMDGICIVSSDSDFTPLAIRIHRAGLKVYGFGARHTPMAFVRACSRFLYVEDLAQ